MLTDLGDVLVIPRQLIDEIRNETKLSFPAANMEVLNDPIAQFIPRRNLFTKIGFSWEHPWLRGYGAIR